MQQRVTRSSQMVNCLREHFIYSEKRPRDLLFRVVEQTVAAANAEGSPLILYRLTRRAAEVAEKEAAQKGLECSSWEVASKAVANAMLQAGVFVAQDGTPIRSGIAAQAATIAGLKERFEDLTEAYLLEVLVRNVRDVSMRDHKALAHALFRQFDQNVPMEDMEDRVVLLMATLAHNIVLRSNGAYEPRVSLKFSVAL
ncbi:MAG: hypothetical protein ABI693_08695 [Bryobacteraceae bacterium]